MRSTFTSLLTDCKSYTQNKNTTDTGVLTFFKAEINRAVRFIYPEFSEYITTYAKTFSTVANQQYYHIPQDLFQISTLTVALGNVTYTPDPIHAQKRWDYLNATQFQGTAVPTYFFQRRDDFGIWPIPQGVYTATINYAYRLRDMTQDDYTTGTISLTNGSANVTGSGGTFTAGMVGRWLTPTTDQYDYRIATYGSGTALTLDNYFQGTTISGDTYTIGESPELPQELHELIPYRVASFYFSGFRKDKEMATYWSNMFWTGDPQNNSRDIDAASGGLLGAKSRYAKRVRTRIIKKSGNIDPQLSRIWGTTLSQ